MSGFRVQHVQDGKRSKWAVFLSGRQVSKLMSSQYLAEAALDRLEREARHGKPRIRPCLGCGRDFRSEGKHNRLCKGCRARSQSVAV